MGWLSSKSDFCAYWRKLIIVKGLKLTCVAYSIFEIIVGINLILQCERWDADLVDE